MSFVTNVVTQEFYTCRYNNILYYNLKPLHVFFGLVDYVFLIKVQWQLCKVSYLQFSYNKETPPASVYSFSSKEPYLLLLSTFVQSYLNQRVKLSSYTHHSLSE